jgi:zinc protease
LNERRQNYENRPYGLAPMAVLSALYPPDHPYHWTTIGDPADLRAATLEDVRDFFTAFYHPRNASLALAGDVDPAGALELVRACFEPIPPGPGVPKVRASASLDDDVRLLLEDKVELPRIYLTWHSPAIFGCEDAALDLVADILANGKNSRLYRTLVYERRIATEVVAVQNSRELSGFFQVIATATPGHTLLELEETISAEIERFVAGGPTLDELQRAQARAEAHFVYGLQSVGGFGGKSDQLNSYNVYLGDPGYFERDLARYRGLTAPDLQAAAGAWLPRARRVALSIVPRGRAELAIPGSGHAEVS